MKTFKITLVVLAIFAFAGLSVFLIRMAQFGMLDAFHLARNNPLLFLPYLVGIALVGLLVSWQGLKKAVDRFIG